MNELLTGLILSDLDKPWIQSQTRRLNLRLQMELEIYINQTLFHMMARFL